MKAIALLREGTWRQISVRSGAIPLAWQESTHHFRWPSMQPQAHPPRSSELPFRLYHEKVYSLPPASLGLHEKENLASEEDAPVSWRMIMVAKIATRSTAHSHMLFLQLVTIDP